MYSYTRMTSRTHLLLRDADERVAVHREQLVAGREPPVSRRRAARDHRLDVDAQLTLAGALHTVTTGYMAEFSKDLRLSNSLITPAG